VQQHQEFNWLRVLLCTLVLLSAAVAGRGSRSVAQAAIPPAQATATPTPILLAPGTEVTATLTVTAEVTATEAAGALQAVDKDGLPVPADYTSYMGDNGDYRQSLTAVSPSPLMAVLQLYRRELSARKWNELPGTVGATDTEATLMFENVDQQARLELKLTRNGDGGTDISLIVWMDAVAKEAGILPPPGQARIYFGNMTDGQVVFAINQKEVTVKPQKPTPTSPKDVPSMDMPPGQYDFTLTISGKEPFKDTIQLGPDQTWALVAGPGGALALEMY
jgi:hypothetical protein